MKRIEAIRNHPQYVEGMEKLRQCERERIFCRHQVEHQMDVARIAYIENLEQSMGFSKELIYAAALLHDIGKYRQYEDGTPHEEASAIIAAQILGELPKKLQFSFEEQKAIIDAILAHRKEQEYMEPFRKLLYESDKRSRACFACEAQRECNWSTKKKNWEITI